MIKQFKNIIHTPKASSIEILNQTQDLIVNTLEVFMPHNSDLTQLDKIFQCQSNRVIQTNKINECNKKSIQQSIAEKQSLEQKLAILQDRIQINLKLIKYLIKSIKQNFVSIQAYQLLQDQTQKAQATIRSHIQMQQQMFMNIQDLQNKVIHYQELANKSLNELESITKDPYIINNIENLNQKKLTIQILQQQIYNLKIDNKKLRMNIREYQDQLMKINAFQKSRNNYNMCRRIVNLSNTNNKHNDQSQSLLLEQENQVKNSIDSFHKAINNIYYNSF